MWNELTFLWNELTILWNDLTIDWNDLTWNDLTMERNDRKSLNDSVALSFIEPYSSQFVSQSRSIPTIPDLFDDENLKLSYIDLLKKCFSVEICLSSEEILQIEKDTQN